MIADTCAARTFLLGRYEMSVGGGLLPLRSALFFIHS